MNRLLWYLLLSVIWMLLRSDFTLAGLLIGFGLSVMTLGLSEKMNPNPVISTHLKEFLKLTVVFLLSVMRANITLARDILWRRRFTHAFFKIDTSSLSQAQTVLLGNMISLTPGSLTLDADDQGETLYIHTLYGEEAEAAKDQIGTLITYLSKISPSLPAEKNKGDIQQ